MKRFQRQIILGLALIGFSASLYVAQIRLFHSERDTFFYLFQDLAFVPIQVLLVSIIVDQVLRIREKTAMLNKLNMVIGVFFSEAGTQLLRMFSGFDRHFEQMREELLISKDWTDRTFSKVAKDAGNFVCRLDCSQEDLKELKLFLASRRDFLLRLLENANLLEHETFTDLLWAVFHLTEELDARQDPALISGADAEHIAGDMKRAYLILIVEWLAYMKHLKNEYPYLFSLAVRTNPFDPSASPIIKQG